jgi:hypothetical protein
VINQNTSGSPDITPNPAIHTDPVAATAATQPLDVSKSQSGGQGIATGTASAVSLALTGATAGPSNAYAELANFGQEVLGNVDTTTGLTQTVTANTAAIQALQAQAAADSNNGINVFCNFATYTNASTITGFTETGTAIGVSGGYASSSGTGSAIYTSTPTNTDYQLVSAVYATAPTGGSSNTIIGRCNAAGTGFVYAAFDAVGGVSLHNVVSGVDTVLDRVAIGAFYRAAPYELECGIEGSVTTYTVLVNGSAVLAFIDSTSVTTIGSSNRYAGFGTVAAGGVASNVAAFGFVDNAPAAIIGDVFKAYAGTSTPILTTSAAVTQGFPSSFFGTIAEQTSNYTYNPSTGILTVRKACVYTAEVSVQWVNNGSPTYTYFGVALYKNGTLWKQSTTPLLSWTTTAPYYMTASSTFANIEMAANDYLQPAYWSYWSGGANYIIGDSSGESVVFSCGIQNTSTSG